MITTVCVKMLTEGPNKNYKPGQVIRVDSCRAAVLVTGKHAEYTPKAGDKVDTRTDNTAGGGTVNTGGSKKSSKGKRNG